MNGKQWGMIIITALACALMGIVIIPVISAILYTTANIYIAVPAVILIEVIAMMVIIAIHSWALLKKTEIKPITSSSETVSDLKEQLNRIKGE